MSQENVEFVRNAFEVIYGSTSEPTATGASMRWNSERAAELFDPNVEVHGTIGGLWEGRIASGLSEMFNSFEAEDLEAWEERRLEPHFQATADWIEDSSQAGPAGERNRQTRIRQFRSRARPRRNASSSELLGLTIRGRVSCV